MAACTAKEDGETHSDARRCTVKNRIAGVIHFQHGEWWEYRALMEDLKDREPETADDAFFLGWALVWNDPKRAVATLAVNMIVSGHQWLHQDAADEPR